jgi:hypothetical protein
MENVSLVLGVVAVGVVGAVSIVAIVFGHSFRGEVPGGIKIKSKPPKKQ